jgi:hypothetical protein
MLLFVSSERIVLFLEPYLWTSGGNAQNKTLLWGVMILVEFYALIFFDTRPRNFGEVIPSSRKIP